MGNTNVEIFNFVLGYPNAGEDVRELPGDGQPAEPVGAGAHAGQGADHHGREHQQDALHVTLSCNP